MKTSSSTVLKTLAVAASLSVGAVSVAAADNHAAAATTISAEFPYEHQFVEVFGSNMAYVEDGEGPVVLFIHGNPTSSYLWRNIIPHVADDHRAIAVDLIGMGASDQPDIGYTLQEHYSYVEGFIEALGLQDITLVLHDWGGALGTYYATNNSDNVRAVAMMEAVTPPFLPIPSWDMVPADARDAFRGFRDPIMGPQMIQEQNMFVEGFLPGSILRPLSDAEMNAYRAPYPTPESRFPVYVWPNEVPIEGEPSRNVATLQEIAGWLGSSDQPKLYLYASPGMIAPPEYMSFVPQVMNNVQTRFIGAGVHFLQEDQPEMIGRNISDWLRDVVAPQG